METGCLDRNPLRAQTPDKAKAWQYLSLVLGLLGLPAFAEESATAQASTEPSAKVLAVSAEPKGQAEETAPMASPLPNGAPKTPEVGVEYKGSTEVSLNNREARKARETLNSTTQIEWLGQRYVLGRRQELGDSSNDEYFLENESPEDWSQLLAVQKLRGEYPGSILENLKRARAVHLEMLKEDTNSTVIRIREDKGEESREGVLMIQATEGPDKGMAVITYLLKPARVEASVAKLQLEAWKERLLAQTRSRKTRKQTQWTQNP